MTLELPEASTILSDKGLRALNGPNEIAQRQAQRSLG
jgi:hypothetical protein